MNKFLLYFSVCLFACHSSGQKAFHLSNKGISCDGLLESSEQKIICGDASQNAGSPRNAAVSVISATETRSYLWDNVSGSRFEKILSGKEQYCFTGYSGSEKISSAWSFSKSMDFKWMSQCSSLFSFNDPGAAMNAKGQLMVASRDPSATAFYAYFSLLDPNGKSVWVKGLDHIDQLSGIRVIDGEHFLIAFRQKGAYIDGVSSKKYSIFSSLIVDQNAQIVQQIKYHIDNSSYIDFAIQTVESDPSGNLIYAGTILSKTRVNGLFVFKTDASGKLLWSNQYPTDKTIFSKSIVAKDSKSIVLFADAYGQQGGFLIAELNAQNGDIVWQKAYEATAYMQIKKAYSSAKGYQVFYDRLLNFANFSLDQKGNSCFSTKDLHIKDKQAVEILTMNNDAKFTDSEHQWKPVNGGTLKRVEFAVEVDCK